VTVSRHEAVNGKAQVDNVFVYGTLMKGFWNHRSYLEGRVSRIIPGKICGLLYHLNAGFPAMLPGNDIVKGEIIGSVDEKLLQSLDRLEGYVEGRNNILYVRDTRKVFTEGGEEMTCWVYVFADERYAQDNGILVPDGDWRKFMQERGEWR